MPHFSHNFTGGVYHLTDTIVSDKPMIIPLQIAATSARCTQIDLKSAIPNVTFYRHVEGESINLHQLVAMSYPVPSVAEGVFSFLPGETTMDISILFCATHPSAIVAAREYTDFATSILIVGKDGVGDAATVLREERVQLRGRLCRSFFSVEPPEVCVVFDGSKVETQTFELVIRNRSEVPLKYSLQKVIANAQYDVTVCDYEQNVGALRNLNLEGYNSKRFTVAVTLRPETNTSKYQPRTIFTGNVIQVENLVDDSSSLFVPVQCNMKPTGGERGEWLSVVADGSSSDRVVSFGKSFVGTRTQRSVTVINTSNVESLSLSFSKQTTTEGEIEFLLDGHSYPSMSLTSAEDNSGAVPRPSTDSVAGRMSSVKRGGTRVLVSAGSDGSDDDDTTAYCPIDGGETVEVSSSSRLNEIVLNAAQRIRLLAIFQPASEAPLGPFKRHVSFTAARGGQTRTVDIECRGEVLSNTIMIKDNEINFRDTAVGAKKVAHLGVMNPTDIEGGVRVEYDSKILTLLNPSLSANTQAMSSRRSYVITLAAASTLTLEFEISPIRVNPRYTKQIKITNINNQNDCHVVTVRSNNVAGAEESSHARFYNIEGTKRSRVQLQPQPHQQPNSEAHSIFMKRAIFFQMVVANFPAIRSCVVTNTHTASLTLSFSSEAFSGLSLYILQPQDNARRAFLVKLIDQFEEDQFLKMSCGEDILQLRANLEAAIASRELVPLETLRLDVGASEVVYVLTCGRNNSEVTKRRRLMTDYFSIMITELGDQPVSEPLEIRKLTVAYHLCHSIVETGQRNVHYGLVQYGDRKRKSITISNNCEVPLYFYIQKSKSVAASHIKTDGLSVERYFGVCRPFGKSDIEMTYNAVLKGKFNEQLRVVNVLNDQDVQMLSIKAEVEKYDTFEIKPQLVNLGLQYVGDLPSSARVLTIPANQARCQFAVVNTSRQSRLLKLRLDPERALRPQCAAVVRWSFTFEEVASEGSSRRIEEEIERLEHKLRIAIRKKKMDKISRVQKRLDKLRRELRGEPTEGMEDPNVDTTSDEEAFETPKKEPPTYSSEDPDVEESLRDGLSLPVIPNGGQVLITLTVTFRKPVPTFSEPIEEITGSLFVFEAKDVESSRAVEFKARLTTKWDVYSEAELGTEGRNDKILILSQEQPTTPNSTPAAPPLPDSANSGELLFSPHVADFGNIVLDRVGKQTINVFVPTDTKFVVLAPTRVINSNVQSGVDAKFRLSSMNGIWKAGHQTFDIYCTPQCVGRQAYRCPVRNLGTKDQFEIPIFVTGVSDNAIKFPDELDFGLVYVNRSGNCEVIKPIQIVNTISKKLLLTAKTNIPLQMQVFSDRLCSNPAELVSLVDTVTLYVRLQPRLESSAFNTGACRDLYAGVQLLLFDPTASVPRLTEVIEVHAVLGHSKLEIHTPTTVNLGRVTANRSEHKAVVEIHNRSERLPLEYNMECRKGSGDVIIINPTDMASRLGAGATRCITVTLNIRSFGMLEETIAIRNRSNTTQPVEEITFLLFADDQSLKTDLDVDEHNYEVVRIPAIVHPRSAQDPTLVHFDDSDCHVPVKIQSQRDCTIIPMSRADIAMYSAGSPPVCVTPTTQPTTPTFARQQQQQQRRELLEVGPRVSLDRMGVKTVYIAPKLRAAFTLSELDALNHGKRVTREGKLQLESTTAQFWGPAVIRCAKMIHTEVSWCMSILGFTDKQITIGGVSSVHEQDKAFEFQVYNNSDIAGRFSFCIPSHICIMGMSSSPSTMARTPTATPPLHPSMSRSLPFPSSPVPRGDSTGGNANTGGTSTDDLPLTEYDIEPHRTMTFSGYMNLRGIDRTKSSFERTIQLINLLNPANVPELSLKANIPKSIWGFTSDSGEHPASAHGRPSLVLPPIVISSTADDPVFIDQKVTLHCLQTQDALTATIGIISSLYISPIIELSALKYTTSLPLATSRFGPERAEREIRVRGRVIPDVPVPEDLAPLFHYVHDPKTATFESSLQIETQRQKPSSTISFGHLLVSTEAAMDDEISIEGSLYPPKTFSLLTSNVTLKKFRSHKLRALEYTATCDIANNMNFNLELAVQVFTSVQGLRVDVLPVSGLVAPKAHLTLQILARDVDFACLPAGDQPHFTVVVYDAYCYGNAHVLRGFVSSTLDYFEDGNDHDGGESAEEEIQETHRSAASISDSGDSCHQPSPSHSPSFLRITSGCSPLRHSEGSNRFLVSMPSMTTDSNNACEHDIVLEGISGNSVDYHITFPAKRADRAWLQLSRETGRVKSGEKHVIKFTAVSKSAGTYMTYVVLSTKTSPVEVFTLRVVVEVTGTQLPSTMFDLLLDTRQVYKQVTALDLGNIYYGEVMSHRFLDVVNRSPTKLDFLFTFGKVQFFGNDSVPIPFEDDQRPSLELHSSLSGTTLKAFGNLRVDPNSSCRVYVVVIAYAPKVVSVLAATRGLRVETELLVKCRTLLSATRSVPVRARVMCPRLVVPSREIVCYYDANAAVQSCSPEYVEIGVSETRSRIMSSSVMSSPPLMSTPTLASASSHPSSVAVTTPQVTVSAVSNTSLFGSIAALSPSSISYEVRGYWHLFSLEGVTSEVHSGALEFSGGENNTTVRLRVVPNHAQLKEFFHQSPTTFMEEMFMVYNAEDPREKYTIHVRFLCGLARLMPVIPHHGARTSIMFNRLEERIARVVSTLTRVLQPWESTVRVSVDNWITRVESETDDVLASTLPGTHVYSDLQQEVEEVYERVFPQGSDAETSLLMVRYLTDELLNHAMVGRPNICYLDLATLLYHGTSALYVLSVWRDPSTRLLRDHEIIPGMVKFYEAQKSYFSQFGGCWEMEV
eukprot:PhM_4_TR13927/c0_g1_i1/m.86315